MTIYSGFSHWKWWFSIVMLVYQRVIDIVQGLQTSNQTIQHGVRNLRPWRYVGFSWLRSGRLFKVPRDLAVTLVAGELGQNQHLKPQRSFGTSSGTLFSAELWPFFEWITCHSQVTRVDQCSSGCFKTLQRSQGSGLWQIPRCWANERQGIILASACVVGFRTHGRPKGPRFNGVPSNFFKTCLIMFCLQEWMD